MATYFFKRGKFFRWGVPMWAGETQAFKLIRLLKKQKIKGILYEEGPLIHYMHKIHHHRPELSGGHNFNSRFENDPVTETGIAPAWFKVTF